MMVIVVKKNNKSDNYYQAFHDWYLTGKPKYGPIINEMRRLRVEFKRTFRYC